MKNKEKKGFTLAELLIVVAIIAVLVAIAIPIFNKQIEKAREAYDIYTMRQAASAAVDLYYAGVKDSTSAAANGLKWNQDKDNNINKNNAYGVYDPKTGKFLPKMSTETRGMSYGKGTGTDGGTQFTLGNENGAYCSAADYTHAVVMVSIYPDGNNKHIEVYWKDYDRNVAYIGGNKNNFPIYSIKIPIK